MLRTHGWDRKYYSEQVGYNSRLDELQAAILRVKLRHLDEWNDARRHWAGAYNRNLAKANLRAPLEREYAHHVYHLYVVDVENRERLAQELKEAGISTGVYYPYPLHLMPVMKNIGYKIGDFPVSESASERLLAIPLFPEMTSEQVATVTEAIQSVTEEARHS